MNQKTILILGGYGGTGKHVCRWLLKATDVAIIIAGRNMQKVDTFKKQLTNEFPSKNISSIFADASDYESLIQAFQNIDMVIDATTAIGFVKNIAQAALEAKVDYLDYHFEQKVPADLETFRKQIENERHVFITQAGFHPGLPAVFVRYGAQYFDRYDKATIAMAMNARFERAEQATEIIPLLTESKTEICKNGSWRKATYKDTVNVEMGKSFGKMKLFPIQMEEIKQTQKMFNLKETGAYVSGFNWFVDNLILPLIILSQKIKKGFAVGLLLKLFIWGVNNFSSSNQGVVFLNEAEGMKDGKKLKVRIVAECNDAYLFTAIPIVACIKQYLAGELRQGLSMMGHVVDEKRLISDMEKMGINISIK